MSKQNAHIIKAAQLKRLVDNNLRTVVTGCLLIFLVTTVQWGVVQRSLLLLWAGLSLFINLLRVLGCIYFQKRPSDDPEVVSLRLNLFRAGLVVSASLWGINPFFILGHNNIGQELFIVYVLVGLTAGSVVAYTVDRVASMSYLIFSILPSLINMINLGNEVYSVMTVAGVIYTVFNFYVVTQYNQDLVESILLRHEASLKEEEIRKLAFNDALTDLPNRRMFQERLERAISMSKRVGHGGALLFIDIDHFKELNDTHGHNVGDLLLKQVAQRLLSSMRETDTVSRFGGDEFVIMTENLNKDVREAASETENIANHLMEVLSKPYRLGSMDHKITVSIGVAVFGLHGYTHDELLKNADVAMYQAKRAGRNAAVVYNSELAPA